MPVTEFPPGCGDPSKGFDFGEFFHDPDFVSKTLEQFALHLHPAICYCLEFQCVTGTPSSFFEPYGTAAQQNGFITVTGIPLPEHIGYQSLVIVESDRHHHWPLIGQWWKDPSTSSKHPHQIDNALFHGLVRLQSGSIFVGYFKAAWIVANQRRLSFEAQLCEAFSKTQDWLFSSVPQLRWDKIKRDSAARSDLEGIHDVVEKHVQAKNFDRAFQIVCILATSHLGASLNRIACLVPVGDELRCIFAHGGDCTDAFSKRVQLPFTTCAPTLHDLHEFTKSCTLPVDDPLYRELAAGPDVLTIDDIVSSNSIVAQIWREGGDLAKWTNMDCAVVTPHEVDVNFSLGVVYDDDPRAIALRLTADDPLVRDWGRCHADSVWLKNCNKSFYAVSMRYGGQPVAIMLADLGYWHFPDVSRDIVPKLRVLEAVLQEFAPHFFGADFALPARKD